MRRRILAMSAVAAVAVAVPCAANAAVMPADQHASKIVVRSADPKGDVVARMGTIKDLSNSDSMDPFKPGTGTAITPSAADKAIDLRKVTYTVVRTGPKPALTIAYDAKGPFKRHSSLSASTTSFEDLESFDLLGTTFAKGYAVSLDNEAKKLDVELDNKAGKKQKCAGLTGALPSGAHVAHVTIPLSCLAAAGLHASPMRSVAAHMTLDMVGTATTSGNVAMSNSVTAATDETGKTRELPLTVK